MKNSFRPKADFTKFVVQELPEELLLYNLQNHQVFALNKTSAFVWQHSLGHQTIIEIAEDYSLKFNRKIPEEMVWLALEQLQKKGLIDLEKNLVNEINLNRREILKKAALSTMVALPLISTLVAPQAVNAQSGNILQQCSACLTKTHDAVLCDSVCQDIVVGHCHDNSGCGEGQQDTGLYTCQECFAGATPAGNGSTISWHALQYKV